jgi:hypothetical protein
LICLTFFFLLIPLEWILWDSGIFDRLVGLSAGSLRGAGDWGDWVGSTRLHMLAACHLGWGRERVGLLVADRFDGSFTSIFSCRNTLMISEECV